MRFKKQIITICLFTFLFLPFQLNKNQMESYANPLAIPLVIGVKEVVTALLLASGIVITGQGVHYALVNETYQRDKVFFDDFVDKVKTSSMNGAISLKSYINKATDIISEVYKLTYDDDYIKNINMPDISVGHASGVFSGGYQHLCVPSSVGYLTIGTAKYLIDEAMVAGPVELYINVNGGTHSVYVKWLNNGKVVPWKFVNSYPVTWSYNASATVPLDSDWEAYREANKDADVDKSLSLLVNGSICADDVLNWDKDWDVTEEKDYPVERVPGIVVENDYVPDKPAVEESDTPTTGDSLWDTLFGFLKSLFSPLINLLSSLWDLIKSLFDMLKGLLTSILDLIKSLVQTLIDAIVAVFVPTLALEDVFNFNQNTFFGQVSEVFNFDKLWNLTPKPYEFEVDFPFYDFAAQEQRPYHLEIKFFENKFMKENINLIRNITTYPLLLISIYFVIMHFLPKRDMD